MAKGAFAPNWADLRNIHGLIGERKPKVVVELGGGCSTVIIAHAIEENLKELGTAGRL
jgi:predicted O-methyltransferase YrrM